MVTSTTAESQQAYLWQLKITCIWARSLGFVWSSTPHLPCCRQDAGFVLYSLLQAIPSPSVATGLSALPPSFSTAYCNTAGINGYNEYVLIPELRIRSTEQNHLNLLFNSSVTLCVLWALATWVCSSLVWLLPMMRPNKEIGPSWFARNRITINQL